MASFTAGTTFTDGVANDVTAAKLGALVTNATPTSGLIQDRTAETVVATNDTLLIGDASDSNNLKRMTVANVMKAELTGTINSTTGTIATLNSTTGTIATLNSTTPTFLGAITASTNTINVGSGQIYKDATGNVGVGTASPSQKLDVSGNVAARGVLFLGDGSSSIIRKLNASTPLTITNSGGTPEMTIDSSGNVGIGTASPSQLLTVGSPETPVISGAKVGVYNGGASLIIIRDTTNDIETLIGTVTGTLNSVVGSATNHHLEFRTNNTERLRIDTSGNVGIGETSILGRLSVKGSTATSSSFSVYVTDSAGSAEFFVRDDGLIGTGVLANSPYNFTTANAANCNIGTNGFLGRSTSSIKYKKDISNLTHGLTEVLKLRPVTYKGKSEYDGSKVFGGLIAEEVHDAGLTEFVQYAEDGSPDSLSYGNMVSLAFKAIQELKAENDSLKSRIEALEAK